METRITSQKVMADGIAATRFTITADGEQAGFLDAHTASGLILNVEVVEDWQGEGLARALYEHADDALATGLAHVPEWGRTDDGHGFAEAMGGYTMDDEEAAEIVGVDLTDIYGF